MTCVRYPHTNGTMDLLNEYKKLNKQLDRLAYTDPQHEEIVKMLWKIEPLVRSLLLQEIIEKYESSGIVGVA